jgi:hypothetical protein
MAGNMGESVQWIILGCSNSFEKRRIAVHSGGYLEGICRCAGFVDGALVKEPLIPRPR